MAFIEERVTKNGKKRYRAQIRLKGRPIQSATFDRLTDAKLWAQQTESEMRQGRYFKTIESKKRTLAELIERFKTDELYRRRADASKVDSHLDWWKGKLGAYFLSDINHIRIAEMIPKLRGEKTRFDAPKSNTTLNRYLASLSVCFSYAVKDLGWVDENPVLKVRKLREPQGRLRFLSPEERKKLLDAAKDDTSDYIYPIVLLALSTGMRWSEIVHLKWNSIDIPRQRIILEKTKNRERRTIPLASPAFSVIKKLEEAKRDNVDYLFPQTDPSKPINPRKAWNRVVI